MVIIGKAFQKILFWIAFPCFVKGKGNEVIMNENNLLQKIRKFINKNRVGVIAGSAVFALVVIIFTVAMVLGNKGKNSSSDKSGEQNSGQYLNASVIAGTRGENPSVDVVAAEVAEIDDSQDPMLSESLDNQKGNGATVNASDILATKTASTSNGIDVSKFQGKIDWNSVAASGIDFAMIRVGYRTSVSGQIFEDPYARYNLQYASAAGIKVGAYFFSSAVSTEEALQEAAWTVDFISKYQITYPVVFDCEGYSASDSRMKSMSVAARTDNAVAFLNYIYNSGFEPMFYSSSSEMTNSKKWDMSRISGNYKVWVAQYPGTAFSAGSRSDYSGSHSMWQYTDQGVVNGISGNVDMNVAYFNYSQVAVAKDTSGIADANNPELGITFTAVNDQVTAKIETNLRSLPSTGGEIVATIKNGEFVTRVAKGDNGWSKLSYNGKYVYAVTSLLTNEVTAPTVANPEAGINFTAANDQVTAKSETNLRSAPTTGSTLVATITNGTFLARTGIGDNGWSRLTYNGQTVYALTSYLTTQANAATTAPTTAATTAATTATTAGVTMTFTAVNEQVTAKDTTNLRDKPSTDTGKIVVELKNGVYVTRTGINETTGWSRLEYNGQTVYAVSSYLKK